MNKVRVEIPITDEVSVVLDADKSPGLGINVESRRVVHCKEYDIQVIFWPTDYGRNKEIPHGS
ncbi:MAG TPA: hypothetical protein PLS21_08305 [Synergistales bacterium]|nr:hypothetical protein [Synergistales bacterium]